MSNCAENSWIKSAKPTDSRSLLLERTNIDAKKYLAELEIIVSPWTHPAQWLAENKEKIKKNVSEESIASFFNYIQIYLHHFSLLFHYINDSNPDSLQEIQGLIDEFTKWDIQSEIQLLIYAHRIQERLTTMLQANVHFKPSEYRRAFTLDLVVLWAFVLNILSRRQMRADLFERKEEEAQVLLNLFQHLLDYSDLGGRARNRILKALIKLSQNCKLYPENVGYVGVNVLPGIPYSGSFGDVFKCEVGGKCYAAKILRIPLSFSDDMRRAIDNAFRQEALIWRQLSHEHLAPFLGITRIYEKVAFISPWMNNGTVVRYLKQNPDTNRFDLIHRIVLGLEYLHSMRITHGDLKPKNIFMDDQGKPLLADFGMSHAIRDSLLSFGQTALTVHRGGTQQYLAPEVMMGTNISYESDMWSFASTLYEIFTFHAPFHTIRHELALYKKAIIGAIPSKPDVHAMKVPGFEKIIWEQMCRCWSLEPKQRPTSSDMEKFFAPITSQQEVQKDLGADI